MTAGTTTSALGEFVITPQLETAITAQSIVLSDINGHVYFENVGGTQQYLADDSNADTTTYAVAEIKFKIDYEGPLNDAAQIKAAWADKAGNDIKVRLTDTTEYNKNTHDVPSSDIYAYWNQHDPEAEPAVTRVLGTELGLKFKKSAAPTRAVSGNTWANEGTASHTSNYLDSAVIDLDDPGTFGSITGTALTGYTATVTTSVKATFYIGIVGINGVPQATTDAYSCNFEVSGTGITPRG